MRNKFVYLFVLSLIYIFCYSQPKNNIEKDISKNVSKDSGKVLKNQIMELEKTISLLDTMTKSKIIFLTQSIDSNKKCIDDTRLRESLRSAEKTINFEQGDVISAYVKINGNLQVQDINSLVEVITFENSDWKEVIIIWTEKIKKVLQ